MKKAILLIILLLVFISMLFSQQVTRIRIAVVNFQVLGNRTLIPDIGPGIQEMIMTNLGQNSLIQIVERRRLGAVVKELRYSGNDLFDYRKAAKVGKLLQAKYIVTGSVVVFGNSIRITSRIVKIQTGEIIRTYQIVCPTKNSIFEKIDYLSQDLEGGVLGVDQVQREQTSPKIEIAFVIDATGSMADEIDVVKKKINSIIRKITNARPRPVIKIAFVEYRDEDDDFVTRVFNFTSDISKLRNHIKKLQASGGGDYEERVTDGLYKALNKLSWSKRGASRMIFLIGDAPPHNPNRIKNIIKIAHKKSISIYSIACSGLNKNGIKLFKYLAANTNASFSFLAYRQEYVARGGQRRVIITRGSEVYQSRPAPSSRRFTDDEAATSTNERQSWQGNAARSRGRISSQYRRIRRPEGRGGRTISPESLSGSSPILRNYRRTGRMVNNLDTILTQNIQRQASRDLGIRFKKKIRKKFVGKVLIKNSNVLAWIYINDKKQLNILKKNIRKILWFAASVNKAGSKFILYNSILKPSIVPRLGVKTFKQILKNIAFYQNNGIINKRWFFNARIIKVVKISN